MTRCDLIVIGASLGGLEALRTVVGGLPADLPAAVVCIQHRGARWGPSKLADLLAASTSWPVADVEDKDAIGRGRVHLAPPDYHLLVGRNTFHLTVDHPVHHSRPSIDVLFESAAEAYGPAVADVVLTGANQDGADGLACVGRRGGHKIVQDPDTAECGVMPAAALAAWPDSTVLPLDSIAAHLVSIGAPTHESRERAR